MFGGVLKSLTSKLGKTALADEAGALSGLVGKSAVAKVEPKIATNVFDKLGITKMLDNELPIYHGTSMDNAENILRKGLEFVPDNRNNLTGMGNFGVSATRTSDIAKKYASQYGNENILSGRVPKGTKVLEVDSLGNGVDDLLTYDQLKKLQDEGYGAVIDISKGQEDEVRLLKDFLSSKADVDKYINTPPKMNNDLLKYINKASDGGFVAPKNMGSGIKTPAPKGRTPNVIRDSISGSKVHPEDMDIMANLIDHARGISKLSRSEALKLEYEASRLAEHYGIPMNTKAKNPLRALASEFDKRLVKEGYKGK